MPDSTTHSFKGQDGLDFLDQIKEYADRAYLILALGKHVHGPLLHARRNHCIHEILRALQILSAAAIDLEFLEREVQECRTRPKTIQVPLR
jgi:hypothetical protein